MNHRRRNTRSAMLPKLMMEPNHSPDCPPLTDEQQTELEELQARIKMYNRCVPELRITLPRFCLSRAVYLSVDLRICSAFYFKCANLRFEEDAAQRIAACLTSFLEQHPLEWQVCAWKNDLITELMLGGSSRKHVPVGNEAAVRASRHNSRSHRATVEGQNLSEVPTRKAGNTARIPSQRFCNRMFSFDECWLLS
jgi:hypothetical protein